MSTSTQEEIVAKGTAAPAAAAPAPAPPAVPDELRERAAKTSAELLAKVREGRQMDLDRRLAARQSAAEPRLGEPIVDTYVAFDLYAYSPIQFIGPPPYQPSRIIAAGEWAVIYAVLFVNPTVDIPHGFAVPPTVQLGGRTYRVNLEQVNLTNVTDGPDDFRQAVFTSPAPDYTLLDFWFQAPDPGPTKPRVMEANLTADILNMAQPYAAFATTIVDVDQWKVLEDIPMRYLIYRK